MILYAQENKIKKNFFYFLESQKESIENIEYLINNRINPQIEKIEREIEETVDYQDYFSLVSRIKNKKKENFLEDLRKMKEFLSKKISYVSNNLSLGTNPEKRFSYHDLPELEHHWDAPLPQDFSIYSLFRSYKDLQKLKNDSFFCKLIKNYLNEYAIQNTQ
jgi:hypothetical protein